MRIVIWGAAERAHIFYNLKTLWRNDVIVGVIDKSIRGGFHSFVVSPPNALLEYEFDALVICSKFVDEIMEEIREIKQGNLDFDIIIFDDIYEELKSRLIEKYRMVGGEEWEWVSYFQNNNLSVWGPYVKPHTESEVYYEDKHPYIMLYGERLYYPDDYTFPVIDGRQVVFDIVSEQYANSPHLYVRDGVCVGGVIVDAGCCEGNFSIRHVKNAKKLYIVENDEKWIEALERTFFPYRDRTILCSKSLGRYSNKNEVCLDDLVEDCEIDFLKMDIEGAEVDSLLGGKEVLKRSHAKCSIASYHRHRDEELIGFIMNSLGYKTEASNGYMFYMYDKDIGDTLDIRRGIIYCEKLNVGGN